MMSAISLLIMLLIMIIIPTILYTIFFLINCPPSPYTFFRRRSETMDLGSRSSKVDAHDSNKLDNDIELIKVGSNMGKYNDKECSICLSSFVEGEELRQLKNCKHLFHRICIDKWVSTQFNCPVCRAFVVNHHFKPQEKGVHLDNRSDFWQGLPDSAGLV
ncbi:hypothetical protein vseg_008047 [Gypsophila vaccaria]